MRLFPLTLVLTCLAVAAYDAAWSAKDTAAVGRWLAPAYRYFTSQAGWRLVAEHCTQIVAEPT